MKYCLTFLFSVLKKLSPTVWSFGRLTDKNVPKDLIQIARQFFKKLSSYWNAERICKCHKLATQTLLSALNGYARKRLVAHLNISMRLNITRRHNPRCLNTRVDILCNVFLLGIVTIFKTILFQQKIIANVHSTCLMFDFTSICQQRALPCRRETMT